MSPAPLTGVTGLPAIDQALQPAWVRNGSSDTQKAYRTALAFEQMLVEQLSRSLVDSSGLGSGRLGGGSALGGGEQESTSNAATGILSSLLPQALSEGVMRGGGLGLAARLTHELDSSKVGSSIESSGGVAPRAGGDDGSTAHPSASAGLAMDETTGGARA